MTIYFDSKDFSVSGSMYTLDYYIETGWYILFSTVRKHVLSERVVCICVCVCPVCHILILLKEHWVIGDTLVISTMFDRQKHYNPPFGN